MTVIEQQSSRELLVSVVVDFIFASALMNRSRSASGWHNTRRIEHAGPDGGPVQIETLDVGRLTPDQRGQLRSLLAVAELVHPNP